MITRLESSFLPFGSTGLVCVTVKLDSSDRGSRICGGGEDDRFTCVYSSSCNDLLSSRKAMWSSV